MTALAAEVRCALRRLARRRAAAGALLPGAVLVSYAGVVRPVASARDALSASSAAAAVMLIVAAAGVIADDRERGRLALAATHPAPAATWVIGRWLALWLAASAVLAVAGALLLGVAGAWPDPVRLAAAAAAALAHLAAFAALAVALSCRVGSTAQVLLLLAVLVAGAVPPEVAAQGWPGWARDAAVAASAALPSSWALGRLEVWTLAGGPAVPWLALALALQPVAWLAAGVRTLDRAELAVRGD